MKLLAFKSLIDLLDHFNTEQKCIKYFEQLRWNSKVRCPFCRCKSPYVFKDSNIYKCSDNRCNKKFNVKTKSIFENSKLPLKKWLVAIYLFSSHKKGISSCQLAKDLGITQKTAWFMLHRIRETFKDLSEEKISGTIEVDETFVGGKNKNRHRDKKFKYTQGRSYKDKTPVLGFVCRETKKVYTYVVPNTSRKSIQPILRDKITERSNIYTDEWWAYRGLNDVYYHNFIQHNIKQYADGDVNTNTIEGFWSHLKRSIIGVYHKTSRRHLQAYCDEISFRYNTRNINETERLSESISNSFGRRLRYNDLKIAS